MDLLNFYYLQRVLESELDLVQTNAQSALSKARQDLGIFGVHEAAVVTQNAPPDLNVLVSGPALCTDPDGERVTWATLQTVDCSQDHLGASTAVVAPGNTRWISVIAEFDQTLATPVTDGNGNTVYTHIYDSFNIYVTMGNEAVIPTAVRPALPADGILLCDIELAFGQVQILTGDVDVTRRQDLIHETGSNIATFYEGTLVDAVVDLFAYVDALSVGTGIAFTSTGNWINGDTIAATTVGAAINEVVKDLVSYNGAARTGVASHVTVGNYCDIANGGLQTALEAICDAVAGHINGGAPAHPDTAITAVAIAGAPESFAGGTTRDIEVALYGHINDRTERSTDETVDGAWEFQNGLTPVNSTLESNNARFMNAPFSKSILGGSSSPYQSKGDIAAGAVTSGLGWAYPWGGANSVSVDLGAGTAQLQDIKMTFDANGDRKIVVADALAFRLYWFDPMQGIPAIIDLAPFFPVGFDYIDAICTDSRYVYVQASKIATGAHYVNALDLTGTQNAAWLANAGATGQALPGTGFGTTSHCSNICVATMDGNREYAAKLACLVEGENFSLAANPAVSIVDATDGTILTSGCGDGVGVVTPADAKPQGGLCSDGTNIYFTWKDVAAGVGDPGGIATATIADATAGSVHVTFPMEDNVDSNTLIFDGDAVWWISWADGIAVYRVAEQAWDPKNSSCVFRFAAFDGLNIWVQELEAVNDSIIMHQIPAAQVTAVGGLVQNVADMIRFSTGMIQISEKNTTSFNQLGRMCFDGDSIWMIMNNVGTLAMSGIVRKLPRAGLR